MKDIKELRGLVATVVTSGTVRPQYAQSLAEMRDWNARNGFDQVEYRHFSAPLVEEGRDQVCAHALQEEYDWVLQIDADACWDRPDALAIFLQTAFREAPWVDVLGAYCQLRTPPYLPTIDTGSGTWEPHPPGKGLLPVIRTGAHFILIKTPILARMGAPWFRSRSSIPPAPALLEVDTFTRTNFGGRNPLASTPEWDVVRAAMVQASPSPPSGVGEDSAFCDKVNFFGGKVAVLTDLVVGHVTDRVIQPSDLKSSMRDRHMYMYCCVGVRGYD